MNHDTAWFLLIVFFFIILLASRKRSRHIPTRSKRIAWAEFVKEYYNNPENRNKPLRKKDYEFDHFHPFSKGGTSEPENIRVIPKRENRRKGAKMPSFWDH